MPADERVLRVVGEWVARAENDLKNAAHTLKLGKDCPTDTVCFHAQQCVEKYVKALLTFRAVPFPKVHDIEQLIGLLAPQDRLPLSIAAQRQLTAYAIMVRYPGWPPVTLGEARRAVALARRVRQRIRKLLPKAALTTKPKGL